VHLAKHKDARSAEPSAVSPLVAFKRLHSQFSASEAGTPGSDGVLTEAVREVAILSTVRHPNVVALEEVCTSGKGDAQTWCVVQRWKSCES
jgi:hypothetical protein